MHSQYKSRDHTGKTRHPTCTFISDSDVLRELSDEVTSHPGYWLILVAVESFKTLALINSGASAMLMGRPLYEKIQKIWPLHLKMQKIPRLEGTRGNLIPTLGTAEVGAAIGI